MRNKLTSIMLVLVLMLTSLAMGSSTLGHSGDTGTACNGNIKLVFYKDAYQAEWDDNDDWCTSTWPNNNTHYYYEDANFANGNADGDDVGNRYNMDNKISSFSYKNDSPYPICVQLFLGSPPDIIITWTKVNAGQHIHGTFPLATNDLASSGRIRVNPPFSQCG